jgi:peptidoglycan/xylan/chitin deacetylase (PgdA/CDA1 family)
MRLIWQTALSLASRGRLSILIFHRVLPERDALLPNEPSAAEFDALMQHVKARFNVLPLSEGVRRLSVAALPERALSITFDDGYADNLAIAAPILRNHGLPATVFVATGYLDNGCMFNDAVIEAVRSTRRAELNLEPCGLGRHSLDSIGKRRAAIDYLLGEIKYLAPMQRVQSVRDVLLAADVPTPPGMMLSRDALRLLVDAGLDVGAHTITHPILARTPTDQAWQEIVDGKRDLERLLGRPVTLFAYPNGTPLRDYGAEHVRMVREAGFHAAVSTAWGAASRGSDMLQLPRFTPWTREPMKFDILMLRNLRSGVEQRA